MGFSKALPFTVQDFLTFVITIIVSLPYVPIISTIKTMCGQIHVTNIINQVFQGIITACVTLSTFGFEAEHIPGYFAIHIRHNQAKYTITFEANPTAFSHDPWEEIDETEWYYQDNQEDQVPSLVSGTDEPLAHSQTPAQEDLSLDPPSQDQENNNHNLDIPSPLIDPIKGISPMQTVQALLTDRGSSQNIQAFGTRNFNPELDLAEGYIPSDIIATFSNRIRDDSGELEDVFRADDNDVSDF